VAALPTLGAYCITASYHWKPVPFYYRVTLCISTVFDAAQCRCCLSRSCFLSTWLKILSNFFVSPVSHHSSEWPQHRYAIPRGTPSVGMENRRWQKICDFRL